MRPSTAEFDPTKVTERILSVMDAIRHHYRARITVTLDMLLTSQSMDDASDEARALLVERPGLRGATIEALRVTPLSLSESLRMDNLAVWQESEVLACCGTDEQRLRWANAVLPSDEIAELARPELFKALAGFRKYNRTPVSAIPHPRGEHGVWTCVESHGRRLPITWVTLPIPTLSALEWATLRQLNEALVTTNAHAWLARTPHAATVATRIHKGTCGVCQREAGEVCALVTIAWAGRTLSREYRL